MASRAEGAARPLTTPEERAALQAELRDYNHRNDPQKRAPECLLWLQRMALLLDPDADKPEFLGLVQDAIEKFKEVRT